MDKVRNWLLPVLLALAGFLEMGFGLFADLVKEMGLPSYYTTGIRIVALLVTVIVTKMQPPSLKREKAARHQKPSQAPKMKFPPAQ